MGGFKTITEISGQYPSPLSKEQFVDRFDKIALAATLLPVLAIPLSLIDQMAAARVDLGQGCVEAKAYLPPQHTVGTGLSIGKDPSPVVLYATSAEVFSLLVELRGELITVDTDKYTWHGLEHGDDVNVYRREGVVYVGPFEVAK